ncbi:MAG TPA: molybdopterin-dependent oxidoreductase [Chloroflexota bacterium]|nr:molybdopterin-dependent oxidoreductase [Chloroflexota bacterium]
METREQLPAHPVPPAIQARAAPALQIDGLVATPRALAAADLVALPRVDLAEPFVCEEGWEVPGLRWRGVRLGDLLALAAPRTEARYVRAYAGEYAVPLALDVAGDALLAESLNGEPLTIEHGAPWRLVVPGGACFTSVKWVERLELTAEPGPDDGQRIARARLGRGAAKPAPGPGR